MVGVVRASGGDVFLPGLPVADQGRDEVDDARLGEAVEADRLGDLRFTVKQNEAFYVHSLAAPGSRLVVDAPVPIRSGDRVTMLGYRGNLHWAVENGSLVIDVPAAARQAGRYAWVFKIAWS